MSRSSKRANHAGSRYATSEIISTSLGGVIGTIKCDEEYYQERLITDFGKKVLSHKPKKETYQKQYDAIYTLVGKVCRGEKAKPKPGVKTRHPPSTTRQVLYDISKSLRIDALYAMLHLERDETISIIYNYFDGMIDVIYEEERWRKGGVIPYFHTLLELSRLGTDHPNFDPKVMYGEHAFSSAVQHGDVEFTKYLLENSFASGDDLLEHIDSHSDYLFECKGEDRRSEIKRNGVDEAMPGIKETFLYLLSKADPEHISHIDVNDYI